MGTNYFLRQKPNENEEWKLKKFMEMTPLEILKSEEFLDLYMELRKKYVDGVHLGKRSGGWKFLLDPGDGKEYAPNKDSLDAWLRKKCSEGGVIYNEYNEYVGDTDDFWHLVDEWNKNNFLDDTLYKMQEKNLSPFHKIYDRYDDKKYRWSKEGGFR